MKTINFLKYLILIFGFGLNSCTSGEEPTPQTFLEKYNGTKWSLEDFEYLKLNNTKNNPTEYWNKHVGLDCYYHGLEGVVTFEIIENSEVRLITKYSKEGASKTITYVIKGEILKVLISQGSSGNIYYFNKTQVNVDELKICDD